MICLICSRFRIRVVFEAVVTPCSAVAAIVFRLVFPRSSVPSNLVSDSGSSMVGFSTLSCVKALSRPSPSAERPRFSARGSVLFSSLVSVFSV